MFQMFLKLRHRCFHLFAHVLVVTFACQGKISVWPSVFASQCTNKPICLHLTKRCMHQHGRWFGCQWNTTFIYFPYLSIMCAWTFSAQTTGGGVTLFYIVFAGDTMATPKHFILYNLVSPYSVHDSPCMASARWVMMFLDLTCFCCVDVV